MLWHNGVDGEMSQLLDGLPGQLELKIAPVHPLAPKPTKVERPAHARVLPPHHHAVRRARVVNNSTPARRELGCALIGSARRPGAGDVLWISGECGLLLRLSTSSSRSWR